MYLNLEDYMLPCITKKILGYDCPGCGIQRSLVHILQGDFITAFNIYPAIYTLLLLLIYALLNRIFRFKYAQKTIIILAIFNICIILTSYFIKMNHS